MLYHKFLLSVLLSIHSLRLVFIINCIKLAIKFEFPISKIHCQLIFLKIISGNVANLDTNESLFDDFIKRAKKKNRSRSHKSNDEIDVTFSSVASSLSKLVECHTTSQELKFKEFHEELNSILRQLPFMTAMKFSLEVMQQAKDLLKTNQE